MNSPLRTPALADPFQVVRDFEEALCQYTGARYAVTCTSCTMALLLAVKWQLSFRRPMANDLHGGAETLLTSNEVQIPKFTYVGVAMSIKNAGGHPSFRDERWVGRYRLDPLPVYDCARWFYAGMFSDICAEDVKFRRPGHQPSGRAEPVRPVMACISFHHTKTLGLTNHGGAILHDSPEADEWLRRARFDGRKEGVAAKDDTFPIVGFHCYMTPATAAEGLMRLRTLPRHNKPLPWGPGTDSDYPDLSQLEIFK